VKESEAWLLLAQAKEEASRIRQEQKFFFVPEEKKCGRDVVGQGPKRGAKGRRSGKRWGKTGHRKTLTHRMGQKEGEQTIKKRACLKNGGSLQDGDVWGPSEKTKTGQEKMDVKGKTQHVVPGGNWRL